MKGISIVLCIISCLSACTYQKEYSEPAQTVDSLSIAQVQKTVIITLDSCEYVYDRTSKKNALLHYDNCKYCKAWSDKWDQYGNQY